MSVPATNAPPAPRSTKTRKPGSASTRSQAETSASYMPHVMALRASGRLKVRKATGPSMSKSVSEVDTRGSSKTHSQHTYDCECGQGARWSAGARCHPGDGRTVLRDATMRHGRGCDQGRTTRGRFDAAHVGRARER